jgi:hypothetical protein
MKTQIDIKSALCGLVIGVAAMFAIGAGTSSNEVGRYQISSNPNFSVMVDTKTGQAWGSVCAPSSGSAIHSDGNFFEAK